MSIQLFIKLLSGKTITLDVEPTDKISDVAKKIYSFKNSCELSLILIKEKETLKEDIMDKARYHNRPVLIKNDKKYSIYGYREGTWKITELNALPKSEQDNLDALPSFYFEGGVSFTNNYNPLLETLKRGHTFQSELSKVTEKNYLRAIGLVKGFRGGRSLDFDKTLEENEIGNEFTIVENPRMFTMSPRFQWDTFAIDGDDAITLAPIEEPILLNPGCLHIFELSALCEWIIEKIKQEQTPQCPTCRCDIDKQCVDYLVKWNLFSRSSGNNNHNQEQHSANNLILNP